jgi:hypothetical protein
MKSMGHAMHQSWDSDCFEQTVEQTLCQTIPPLQQRPCAPVYQTVPVPCNVSPPMATTGTQATSACEAPSAQLNLGFAWGLFRNTASDKDRGYKAIMVGSDIRVEFSTYIHLDG